VKKTPAELIHARGNASRSEIHKLINSMWNNVELPQQWNEFITAPIYKRMINLAVLVTEGYHCYQPHTLFYPIFLSEG